MIQKSIWITAITSTLLLDGLINGAIAASSFTIGTNFTGTTLNNTVVPYVPPDGEATVGPNDLVEFINGAYAVYNKSTGALEQPRTSLDQFYQQAGIANPGEPVDPRILYDASSGHFFAVSRDTAGQNFLLAVSNDSNPLDGWSAYSYAATSISGTSADFPTIGLSQDGVYISASIFGEPTGSSIISFDKQSLINGNPISTSFLNNDATATGFVIQPSFQPGTTNQQYLLSSVSTNFFQKAYLVGPAASPTLETALDPGPFNNYFISVPAFDPPNPAKQPNGDNTIDTGDSRLGSTVILYDGLLWGTQTVQNGANSAIRWFAIDPNSTDTFGGLVYSGLISDPNLDFYYGSIAIDANGDIVIGFTGSGSDQYASAYAVVGSTNDGGTPTFGNPFVTGQGNGNYDINAGSGNRWGDYSTTEVDPSNPDIIWTSQEFAQSTNVWAIQNTEIIFNNNTPTEIPESNLNLGLFSLALLAIGSRFKRKK